ncbi:hypothetical protein GLOTRDRAFT_97041 [Gloeophyllum trabeum ATCC 11539]|uniref:Uncharacterized protein n=1 Tax=Gloeophyllum trabeum (strain ATCC 11539 / FP-39264 / Madison 617) TaxID=670483 RepID=S7R7U3_GLOTA|nr:uncharacterized protein GLOTRDRAFT_97041 [Gloeophyllum trabeum ATCC 11539]EPQ50425.1 hypothetical protein GLOTRDRAFT_97041 [Gloeophyllum trabeum ATCC 11539]
MSWYTNSYAEDRELLAGSPKCDTVLLRLTNLHVRGNLIPCVELLPNLTLPTLGRLDLALGSLDCSLGRNRTTDIIEIEVSEAIKPLTGLIANTRSESADSGKTQTTVRLGVGVKEKRSEKNGLQYLQVPTPLAETAWERRFNDAQDVTRLWLTGADDAIVNALSRWSTMTAGTTEFAEKLARALKSRQDAGHPLERLHIRGAEGWTDNDVRSLQNVVKELTVETSADVHVVTEKKENRWNFMGGKKLYWHSRGSECEVPRQHMWSGFSPNVCSVTRQPTAES